MNLYEQSWELYKEHSSSFTDDLDYYTAFTKGRPTLEMFAGYGRVTNHLVEQGVDVETIELSPDFSRHINLPPEKCHVGDVTQLVLDKTFERIIACYNSFCLLTTDASLTAFFRNVDAMLKPGGIVSLSYYHPDAWASAVDSVFEFQGERVLYIPSHDLSRRSEKHGTWTDTYRFTDQEIKFNYPVRIFETFADLQPYFENTTLRLSQIIENYANPQISEPGWKEFILKKPL